VSTTLPRGLVVIVADQLRADHLGCYGDLPVRTPHINGLASRGQVFDRAFVANPVCMPNRATIMTGRWPSAHGLRTNGIPLDPTAETFARVLRSESWRTSAVGKLHFQPNGYGYEEYQLDAIKEAMPQLWARAVTGPFGEDFQSWESFERHIDGDTVIPEDYYGFDDVALVSGHGDRVSGNYVAWARARGFDPRTQAGRPRALSVYPGWNHVYESATPAALHPTNYIAEASAERIREAAKSDQPFLIFVSFPDPHHPFAPPAEYFHRHRPEDMPLPATFHDAHEDSPDYIKRMVARRGTPDIDPMMLWSPTEEQFQHALAAELGSIEFIDDSVGQILSAIESSGLSDSTIVAFTSDHGDVFGDHGLMLKHFCHYQSVIRVPLILTGPGIDPGRRPELVSSADIAPTLLDLTHSTPLPRAQGRSLVPLMEGCAPSWRSSVLIEEDQPYGVDGLPAPVRIRTIVSDSARLTEIAGQQTVELFDLTHDSNEMSNVAVSSPELLSRARAEMIDQLMRVSDDSVVPFNAA
jgi:arylsulfatase A-like enzyme